MISSLPFKVKEEKKKEKETLLNPASSFRQVPPPLDFKVGGGGEIFFLSISPLSLPSLFLSNLFFFQFARSYRFMGGREGGELKRG